MNWKCQARTQDGTFCFNSVVRAPYKPLGPRAVYCRVHRKKAEYATGVTVSIDVGEEFLLIAKQLKTPLEDIVRDAIELIRMKHWMKRNALGYRVHDATKEE